MQGRIMYKVSRSAPNVYSVEVPVAGAYQSEALADRTRREP